MFIFHKHMCILGHQQLLVQSFDIQRFVRFKHIVAIALTGCLRFRTRSHIEEIVEVLTAPVAIGRQI